MQNKKSPEDFWKMVDVRSDKECWLWRGAQRPNGYGVTKYGGPRWSVHRLAWTLVNGEIPTGMLVCHKCDTPLCCNPRCLFLGTVKDNMQDMLRKGRDAITGNKSWARRHPELLPRGDDHPARANPENWQAKHQKFFFGNARRHPGQKNGRAIVTEDQVREIRRRWDAGESQEKLSQEFGLKQTSVGAICRRRNWRHVK